jgi:hypothetical protein
MIPGFTQSAQESTEHCNRRPAVNTACNTTINNKKYSKLFMQLSISNVQFIAVCKNFLPVRGFGVLLGKIASRFECAAPIFCNKQHKTI